MYQQSTSSSICCPVFVDQILNLFSVTNKLKSLIVDNEIIGYHYHQEGCDTCNNPPTLSQHTFDCLHEYCPIRSLFEYLFPNNSHTELNHILTAYYQQISKLYASPAQFVFHILSSIEDFSIDESEKQEIIRDVAICFTSKIVK